MELTVRRQSPKPTPPHQSPCGDSFSTREKPYHFRKIRNHALLNTKHGLVFDSVGYKRLPQASIAPAAFEQSF